MGLFNRRIKTKNFYLHKIPCAPNDEEKLNTMKLWANDLIDICAKFNEKGYFAGLRKVNLKKLVDVKNPLGEVWFYPSKHSKPVKSTVSLLGFENWKYQLALAALCLDFSEVTCLCNFHGIAPFSQKCFDQIEGIIGKNETLYNGMRMHIPFPKSERKKLTTRDEINRALDVLSKSTAEFVTPPPDAMCYSRSFNFEKPECVERPFVCEKCGNTYKMELTKSENRCVDNTIKDYKDLAAQYNSHGFKMEFKVICEHCLNKNAKLRYEPGFSSFKGRFRFMASEDSVPVTSYASIFSPYNHWRYKTALSFLIGEIATVEQLYNKFHLEISSKEYYENIEKVVGDVYKTRIPPERDMFYSEASTFESPSRFNKKEEDEEEGLSPFLRALKNL